MLAMVVQFREEGSLWVFSLFSFLSVPPDFEETHKGAGEMIFSKFHGLLTTVTKLCVRACVCARVFLSYLKFSNVPSPCLYPGPTLINWATR